jgi:hypothetical protein
MVCLKDFNQLMSVCTADCEPLLWDRDQSWYGPLYSASYMNFIIQNVKARFSDSDSYQTWKPNIRPPITGF